jgi:hypothetical protein
MQVYCVYFLPCKSELNYYESDIDATSIMLYVVLKKWFTLGYSMKE